MKDIRNALFLMLITLFFIIGAGVLYQFFPTEEDQQLLFKTIVKILIIAYGLVLCFLYLFEYIRNKKLPKEKRSYKITTTVLGMMIITLLFAWVGGSLFGLSFFTNKSG